MNTDFLKGWLPPFQIRYQTEECERCGSVTCMGCGAASASRATSRSTVSVASVRLAYSLFQEGSCFGTILAVRLCNVRAAAFRSTSINPSKSGRALASRMSGAMRRKGWARKTRLTDLIRVMKSVYVKEVTDFHQMRSGRFLDRFTGWSAQRMNRYWADLWFEVKVMIRLISHKVFYRVKMVSTKNVLICKRCADALVSCKAGCRGYGPAFGLTCWQCNPIPRCQHYQLLREYRQRIIKAVSEPTGYTVYTIRDRVAKKSFGDVYLPLLRIQPGLTVISVPGRKLEGLEELRWILELRAQRCYTEIGIVKEQGRFSHESPAISTLKVLSSDYEIGVAHSTMNRQTPKYIKQVEALSLPLPSHIVAHILTFARPYLGGCKAFYD